MEAKKISQKAVKSMINSNTVLLHMKKRPDTEMQYNMITEEAQRYINDNGLGNELYDIVYEWLVNNSRMEPTFVDYSEVELNDFLQK